MGRTGFTLLGPDVLLVAMGEGRANNAVLAIDCSAPMEVQRLMRAVAELRVVAPFMACRLERPWPWGRLRWRAVDESPPVASRRLGAGETVEDAVDAVLNEVVDPRRAPPLRWHLLTTHDGLRSWLLLAWVHPLMDPRGAELLVAMLHAVDQGGVLAARALSECITPPEDPRDWRTRTRLAQQGLPGLQALARAPARSLADGLGVDAGTPPGRVRHRRRLVRSRPRAMPVALAAVAGAVADVWRARAVPLDGGLVVPLSVDRRRAGELGPVFGNFLSFHFARVDPQGVADQSATAAAVRRDLAEAVRNDAVEALWAGMNLIRHYPPRHLLRPLGGRTPASFHFADTGAVRPLGPEVLGAPVHSAYHVACVQPHPGLGIFCTRVGELESLVAVWVEGRVTAAEVDDMLEAVATGLDARAA